MRRWLTVAAASRFPEPVQTRRSLRSMLLVVTVGVLLGGTAAIWAFPSGAKALDPCQFVNHYNTMANTPNQHHGVRVANPGMIVYHITPSCIHVSTILSVDTTTLDWMEIGWQDIENAYVYNLEQCTINGDGNPHTFRVVNRDGIEHCTNYASISVDGYEEYGVADQNGDDNWTFYMNGSTLGTNPVSNTFSLSESITNGERYTNSSGLSPESAAAYFSGLQYMPLNGAWTSWGQAQCYNNSWTNDDPNYNNQLLSATTVQVSTASAQC
ncbi:MAG TPA: hypothetical protein VFU30_11850 [Gaiellaceae bacterium]|nr:hypothetical protein [Gaiellaceae bacterium]